MVAAVSDRLAMLPALPMMVPGIPANRSNVEQDGEDEVATVANIAETPLEAEDKFKRQPTYYVEEASLTLRKFLDNKESSMMKAWFRHLDKNMSGRIDFQEFKTGMVALRFPGSVEGIWADLDKEELGEVAFEDLFEYDAMVWQSFRRWCGSRFQSPRDMIKQLKRAYVQVAKMATNRGSDEAITEPEFIEGLRLFGWDQGNESTIYMALEPEGESCISVRDLRWLEVEIRRFRQKEAAKKRAMRAQEQRARNKQACQVALLDFKAFLKKQFGNLFRAWRNALDNDGSMSVQRADLFKVCRSLNWRGDVRALWKALDHDGSGVTTLEELDPQCAQLLAQFKEWAVDQFGSKPSAKMWQTFDKQRRRKLSYSQFMYECEVRGFRGKAKTLATWLDWQDKRYLQEEDLQIVDTWKPPAWLSAKASLQAAEDFKKHLLQKYGHVLKAWRCTMDKDSSNCCNWHEFQDAAKHVKFVGDSAAAWLAFDEDLSGYITLKEIDAASHFALVEFKRWADEQFGGVRSAFKVLDGDNSNELSYLEFRKACRNFGFPGDVKALFDSLDQHGEQKLQYKEVVFLDDWEVRDEAADDSDDCGEEQHGHQEQDREQAQHSRLIDYRTIVPGPGNYEVLPGFGAMPSMPTARHGGAFTFTGRRQLWRMPKSVGPCSYEPSIKHVRSRKPAWSFGSASGRAGGMIEAAIKKMAPGPGSYEVRTPTDGPKFTMRPRRGLTLHPSQRVAREPVS